MLMIMADIVAPGMGFPYSLYQGYAQFAGGLSVGRRCPRNGRAASTAHGRNADSHLW
jgi:hypothetical protein